MADDLKPDDPGFPASAETERSDSEEGHAQDRTDRELFATFLSHEIRQPLSSLALWLDLLESTLGVQVGDKEQEYMDRIHEEVERLTEIVDEQLIFSGVTSLTLEREWVQLEEVVRDVLNELRPAVERIQATIDVGPLPRVFTDRRLLHPLVRNLVANAIQYRRPGVPLEIRVSSREPEARPDMECEVLVADNGRGFPAEDAERMFRMFERLDRDGPPGTGLGLAICHRIAERLGGSLTAESEPGEGATFILSLPRHRVDDCSEPNLDTKNEEPEQHPSD